MVGSGRARVSTVVSGVVCLVLLAGAVQGQTAAETFVATATLKGVGGGSATAPVTITIDRKLSQHEIETLTQAFSSGGVDAFRKALVGVSPTGSVRIGAGTLTPARLTIERPTSEGRLLTIITDQPLLFVGASLPGAKPRAGYDFAVIDIVLDAHGTGSGTVAPAASIRMNQGAFVVSDYGAEVVQLSAVKQSK